LFLRLFPYISLMMLLLAPTAQAAPSGGTLVYDPAQQASGDFRGWSGYWKLFPDEGEPAKMSIEGKPAEDVLVYNADCTPTIRLVITKNKPYRLFCDTNLDNQWQLDEKICTFSFDEYCGYAADVKVPVKIGPLSQFISLCAYYYEDIDSLTLSLSSNLHYHGSITVNGKEYAARLGLLSINPSDTDKQKRINEYIILDTNKDGDFNHFNDAWFCCGGVAWLDDTLWSVDVEYTQDSIKVELEPYGGDTGILKIDGTYVHRLYFERTGNEPEAANGSHILCLPRHSEQTYLLPTGFYETSAVWLHDESYGDVYFMGGYLKDDNKHLGQTNVTTGATATLYLGGPLKSEMQIHAMHCTGFALIDYVDVTNPIGMRFRAVDTEDGTGSGSGCWVPFDILNTKGKVVVSSFTSISPGLSGVAEMPILSMGTYTFRISGNNTFSRIVPETSFIFLPLRLLLPLVCVIFMLFVAWLMHRIDQHYSPTRYMALLPGALGLIGLSIYKLFWLMHLQDYYTMALGYLLMPSLVLLLWRWWKVKRTSLALCAIVLVSLLGAYICLLVHPGLIFPWNYEMSRIVRVFALAGYLAYPLLAIRLALYRGITAQAVFVGIFMGWMLPVLALRISSLITLLENGQPWMESIYSPMLPDLYLIFSILPFCLLIRYNTWCRAVADGTLYDSNNSSSNIEPPVL
jgi:hypothetical protein